MLKPQQGFERNLEIVHEPTDMEKFEEKRGKKERTRSGRKENMSASK